VSVVAPNASSKPSVSRRRLRFPRRIRLLKHADFERVYKQGLRHFAAHITVFYLARSHGQGLRVGFTVGRVLGGAVDRNRMKRRLREAVRLLLPEKPAPVDVVINPKKSMLGIEFAMLEKEVSRAFDVIQKFAEKLPPAAE
jgi:ribonuclease P protein component